MASLQIDLLREHLLAELHPDEFIIPGFAKILSRLRTYFLSRLLNGTRVIKYQIEIRLLLSVNTNLIAALR